MAKPEQTARVNAGSDRALDLRVEQAARLAQRFDATWTGSTPRAAESTYQPTARKAGRPGYAAPTALSACGRPRGRVPARHGAWNELRSGCGQFVAEKLSPMTGEQAATA